MSFYCTFRTIELDPQATSCASCGATTGFHSHRMKLIVGGVMCLVIVLYQIIARWTDILDAELWEMNVGLMLPGVAAIAFGRRLPKRAWYPK